MVNTNEKKNEFYDEKKNQLNWINLFVCKLVELRTSTFNLYEKSRKKN